MTLSGPVAHNLPKTFCPPAFTAVSTYGGALRGAPECREVSPRVENQRGIARSLFLKAKELVICANVEDINHLGTSNLTSLYVLRCPATS